MYMLGYLICVLGFKLGSTHALGHRGNCAFSVPIASQKASQIDRYGLVLMRFNLNFVRINGFLENFL